MRKLPPPQKQIAKPSNQIQRKLPSVLSLEGPRQRGNINMRSAGKPPKLRFQPGTYVRYQGGLYEIIYVYRVQDTPHEWMHCLEERKDLGPAENQPNASPLHGLVVAMGAGATTPRIVYELFCSHQDASSYFWDIPSAGDQSIVSNKKLIQHATVVSSGSIVPTSIKKEVP